MQSLPSGTVTFLFTDIEGSTRRWEAQPQAMSAALSRHDALLRSFIEQAGGYIFKTMGDAFYGAFATPHLALQAALQATRALHGENWVEGGVELKARMALHTGVTEERDGDYFGPTVNRVARLLSAGHGGQVLLSAATQELLRDALPPGVTMRDVGEHRLKDLIRPERVFQLVIPGLPSEFPPLRTLDARPNNLPFQPTPLIGREKEVGEVIERLLRGDVHLLTLTGPGGTGKTRLALQVGAETIEEFEDGVYFVNLAAISDPGLVAQETAQALAVREAAGRPLVDTLKEYLRDKRMLLVLDNFEQVIPAATFVSQLTQWAPHLKVLVTSRIALRVRGEREYPVPPLTLPDPKHLPPPEQLSQYEAVRLFIERAADIRPDFEVTNENAPAVAEICYRLDGLPLAIELAAARIRTLPPQAMLSRLESRLKLLSGGAKDLPARQQTLRNTIEWSYDLLDGGEKQLFRRLAVFVGGGSLEAIEAVCNVTAGALEALRVDVLDGVESLVAKSLLRQEEGAGGEPRFTMLGTIHDYALERLQESSEAEDLRRCHALYFVALAEQAEPGFRGPDQTLWFDRSEEEHDNMLAVLRWSAERGHTGDPEGVEIGLRLASVLWYVWWVRGYFMKEGREQMERLIALADQVGCSRENIVKALRGTGVLAFWLGDYPGATSLLERALAAATEHGDKPTMARLVWWLGAIKAEQKDYIGARPLYEESLALYREIGDKSGTASALDRLAMLAYLQADATTARTLFKEVLALHREVGIKSIIAGALGNMGHVEFSARDYQAARSLYIQSLTMNSEVGDKYLAATSLGGLAGVAAETGDPRRAARLLGAAESLIRAVGTILIREDRLPYDKGIASARSQLGDEEFERLWREGQAMSIEQAREYALLESAGGLT